MASELGSVLLIGGGVMLAFLLGWWAHVRYWVGRLSVALPYASVERIDTPDGSAIELRRLESNPTADGARGAPVLMVHGLAANHRNNDVHPDASFARCLAQHGHDVWLLTLRSGRSDRRFGEGRKVCVEAMVEHDLPLAIEAVCDRTGAEQVDYVGYSMGGMLLFAALCRTVPVERVRRAIFLAAPGCLSLPIRALRLLRWFPRWLVPALPLRLASRTWAFAVTHVPSPFHDVLSNRRNVIPFVARTALVDVIQDIPARLHRDLAMWALRDGEIRLGGASVLDGLAEVQTPALFFAASSDRIVPVWCVRRAYDRWGCDRPGCPKELRILGRDGGARAEYGHGDLAVGRYVRADVFEPALRFLQRTPPVEAPVHVADAASDGDVPRL